MEIRGKGHKTMSGFLTLGALLAATYAFTASESFGSLLPGQTEVLYYSSVSYTAQINSPGSIIQDSPSLPNLAGFNVEADLASYGGSVDTQLYSYSGAFEVDLGTTVLNGVDSVDDPGDVFGFATAVPITSGEQQALFNQTCPYFEMYGYPASECTGWFQAYVTNNGMVPINLIFGETNLALLGKDSEGGIFAVSAEALPSDIAQRFPDGPPAPEPGSLLLALGASLIAVAAKPRMFGILT